MCCLFGLLDYKRIFSAKEKSTILNVLGAECEARGTDAAGIAYNSKNRLHIYKRPLPAHQMRFRIPEDSRFIMGHTRLTTQGDEKKNRNNHPFAGNAGGQRFAFAHNGVLYNDRLLRNTQKLPRTKIETDSYVAVQLIEKQKTLDFDSLKYMAEQVDGSFVFTALEEQDNCYFVKGDNPLCLLHFPRHGFYLYASTEEILKKALKRLGLSKLYSEAVKLFCGDILCIDKDGSMTQSVFEPELLYQSWYLHRSFAPAVKHTANLEASYITELKGLAMYFGYTPEDIDALLADGFQPEELEELFYCGEL